MFVCQSGARDRNKGRLFVFEWSASPVDKEGNKGTVFFCVKVELKVVVHLSFACSSHHLLFSSVFLF